MKKINKILTALLATALIISLAAGISVLATPANSDVFSPSKAIFNQAGYGSYDVGVPWNGNNAYYPPFEVDGHGNLNFEKGLEGWVVKDPARGKLKVDSNGNRCVTIIADKSYDGIRTIMFPISKLKEGSTPGLLYKWRGEAYALQITLTELYELKRNDRNQIEPKTAWVGAHEGYGATHIWAADEDNPEDWNISFTINKLPVAPLSKDSATDQIYYYVTIEAMNQPNIANGMDVDDIQVVIHDAEGRKILDLDGNVLYDLNNLPKRKLADYDFAKLDKEDKNAKIKVDVNDLINELTGKKKIANILPDIASDSESSSLVWVIIAAGALLVIAAAVVTVVVIRKKRKTVNSEQSDESTEETIE